MRSRLLCSLHNLLLLCLSSEEHEEGDSATRQSEETQSLPAPEHHLTTQPAAQVQIDTLSPSPLSAGSERRDDAKETKGPGLKLFCRWSSAHVFNLYEDDCIRWFLEEHFEALPGECRCVSFLICKRVNTLCLRLCVHGNYLHFHNEEKSLLNSA